MSLHNIQKLIEKELNQKHKDITNLAECVADIDISKYDQDHFRAIVWAIYDEIVGINDVIGINNVKCGCK